MTSLTQQLAAFLKARPHQWIGAREFEQFGRQAWRTRIADCRQPPYSMRIENRVRIVRQTGPIGPGRSRTFKVSEYRLVGTQLRLAPPEPFHCTCAEMAEPPCGYCDGPDRDL